MFFSLCFFAFSSVTTVDLLMMERKMVVREVRGEQAAVPGMVLSLVWAGYCLGALGCTVLCSRRG